MKDALVPRGHLLLGCVTETGGLWSNLLVEGLQ